MEGDWARSVLLEHLLRAFWETGNILGIDICGECQQGIPLPEYMEAEVKNAETNRKLFEFLTHYIRRKSAIPRKKAPDLLAHTLFSLRTFYINST